MVMGFAEGGYLGASVGNKAVEEGAFADTAVAAEKGGLALEVGEEGAGAFGSARPNGTLHT